MSIVKGSVVRAKAGREKGSFFVALKVEDGYAYIADGKTRRIEKPKKKKLIHLSAANKVIESSLETNPQIKRILSQFKNGG